MTAYVALAWWPLFPSFLALTCRLAIERACAEPYDLLPALTSKPAWAWTFAAVYVLAHAWLVSAYLLTVASSQSLLPRIRDWQAIWGSQFFKVWLMFLAFAIEYAPVPMWRLIGAALHCSR
jgi:hypothetical protein